MARFPLIWIGMLIGSVAGSFIPELWGSGVLSISSVIWSGLGGAAGIWIGYKLTF
jgi:hypothetical protein